MQTLPTPTALRLSGFGQLSRHHNFTQEASYETSLLLLYKSGYLSTTDLHSIQYVHPLFQHLYRMYRHLSTHNFTGIQERDPKWASQTSLPPTRKRDFLACLLHYDMRVADVMRFAGTEYTGAYRDISHRLSRLQGLVDPDLLSHYIRIMTVGAPAQFHGHSSRENALLHWRMGNHPSIQQKCSQVAATMNKEERNAYVMPFSSWTARFCPHIFFTPQHILEKPRKPDRQIFDASRRFTPTSIPVNMMTSTEALSCSGDELQCLFGNSFTKVLTRIWNLRISYPNQDIVVHASDVKSCFRQLKQHPDVAGALSFIKVDIVYVPCGLTFGSDFSPATWEVCRRMVEQMSQALFDDDTLVLKNKHILTQLQWGQTLGRPRRLIQATPCPMHRGVTDSMGRPENTPHYFYVDVT
jgi:hypothetical protein